MYYGVTINGTNTLEEYGLVLLSDVSIAAPERKEYTVDIAGADGVLDLSDYPIGRPTYNNRTVSFKLFAPVSDASLRIVRSALMNKYHGQEVAVIFPDDEDHYFKGVCKIGEMAGYNSGTIPVAINADPWRYKATETSVTITATAEGTSATLGNECRPSIPTITADNDATIELDGSTYAVSAGTHKVLDFELQMGANNIVVKGTGNVTFEYQEAGF